MAESSLPAAIDYLYQQIKALPECQAPVHVADGWPVTRSNTLVTIGVVPDADDTEATITTVELGSNMEYEDIQLPCMVAAYRGTKEAKTPRDEAFRIFSAIGAMIREDRTLGKAIRPGQKAMMRGFRMEQTAAAAEAGDGRQCRIFFTLGWQHRF